jgi:hypothetical protein
VARKNGESWLYVGKNLIDIDRLTDQAAAP